MKTPRAGALRRRAGADADRSPRRDRARTAPSSTRAGERRAEHDAPARDRRRQRRAGADRDREQREIGGDGVLVAADQRLDQRRQQRQHDDAGEPEPARHQRAPPQPRVGAQMADHRRGRGGDVGATLELRRAFAGRRNEQRRTASRRAQSPSPARAKAATSPPPRAARPPTMVPVRMAMKVAPSTSALAAGNSSRAQMIGQDAVFDRPEQRGQSRRSRRAPRTASAATAARSRAPRRRRRRSRRTSAIAPPAPCRSGRRVRRRAPDRKKYGAMKIALASVISASASASPRRTG